MKNSKFVLAALWLAAVSCADREELVPSCADRPAERFSVGLRLSIGVGAESSTRAGRPLAGTDAWQMVQDVRLYLFYSPDGSEGSYTYYRPCVEVAEGSSEKRDYLYIKEFEKNGIWRDDLLGSECRSVELHPLLDRGGFYRLLAVGHDDAALSATLKFPTWNEGRTRLDEAKIRSLGRYVTAELFTACSEPLFIGGAASFELEMTLRRAVAGVLMYIENVPDSLVAMASVGIAGEYEDDYSITVRKGEKYAVAAVGIAPVSAASELFAGNRQPCGESRANTNFIRYMTVADMKGYGEGHKADGYYVGTSENPDHPNSVLNGGFCFPQQGPWSSMILGPKDQPELCATVGRSLYLVFYTSPSATNIVPFYWIPLRIDGAGTDSFDLKANHIYCLGHRCESTGEDSPFDLKAWFEGRRSAGPLRCVEASPELLQRIRR